MGRVLSREGLANTRCIQDVWRVLSCSYDGTKIQESRMRENLTYGLTRGKGETDSLLRSFSYSTGVGLCFFRLKSHEHGRMEQIHARGATLWRESPFAGREAGERF